MHTFPILSFLVLVSTGLSSPFAGPEAYPAPVAAAVEAYPFADGVITPGVLGTAIGGALATPTAAPLIVDIASPPEFLTITIINSHQDAISTVFASNGGVPAPVSGNTSPGTMANGGMYSNNYASYQSTC